MKTLKDYNILLVDDTPENIDILVDALGMDYSLTAEIDGVSALQSVAQETPDLILLDIMMPGMDGFEVCRRLKANPETAHIPIMFISALATVGNKSTGFSLGAVDYITKPFDVEEVKQRVRTHLSLAAARHTLEHKNEILEERVQKRIQEIQLTQNASIEALAVLAEYRDPESTGHIKRMKYYAKAMAERLRLHPNFFNRMDKDYIDSLVKAAPLHDIGKVGVPDDILLKPGKLSDEEFEQMKLHPLFGRRAVDAAEKFLGPYSFLRMVREVAYTHHEYWDGSGYPLGLRGEQIPLSGRIVCITDVYDALISKRVYKIPVSHQQAVDSILESKGKQFDPEIVDAFFDIQDEIRQIAYQYADHDEERVALSLPYES